MSISKKLFSISILFLLLVTSLTIAQSQEENIEKYAGLAGTYLLKFQEIFMSALTSLSFGAFGDGGLVAFQQFLLMAMVFIVVYAMISFLSLIPEGVLFPISLAITILSFLFIDVKNIQMMISNYESVGILITVVIPVMILLAFSFRMYNRAYNGKGRKSPFFAEMFNLIFLVFFGFFFLRQAGYEEGMISFLRVLSGWILIIIGVTQTVLYKILAGLFHKWKEDSEKMKNEMGEIKEKYKEEREKLESKVN